MAIPHLSRDLLACYDGNGSNFGTHPQNVLRGMIYENGEYPYLYNLIDQFRYQARFNHGYACNMMFVGPGWMNKIGTLVDLRPYVAKLIWPVGIGTPHVQDASYSFLIQEKYRAGYFTYYAGEGTLRSAKLSYKGEEVDLCLCRTKAHVSERGGERILTLDPVELVFSNLTVKLQTVIAFPEGSGEIRTETHSGDE